MSESLFVQLLFPFSLFFLNSPLSSSPFSCRAFLALPIDRSMAGTLVVLCRVQVWGFEYKEKGERKGVKVESLTMKKLFLDISHLCIHIVILASYPTYSPNPSSSHILT